MGRIFGVLLFVVALWFMASLYSGGFDGLGSDPGDGTRAAPATERVRDAVTRAQQENDERRRKLLGE